MKIKFNFATLLMVLSCLIIIRFTIFPDNSLGIGSSIGGVNIVPFKWIKESYSHSSIDLLLNLGGNIALFVPFGLSLPLCFKKIRRLSIVIFIGTSTSILIEFIQMLIPNRWSDIDDIILNSLGMTVGYIIFTLFHRITNK